MKRKVVSLLFIIVIVVGCSSLVDARPDSFLISTLYTVAGIMFSIGLGLIVTFNISGVKNKNYIQDIRLSLRSVRNSFLVHFGLATTYLLLNQYLPDSSYSYDIKGITIYFSFPILFCGLLIYSIIFFIINFLEVQKLNHDIFDKINSEQ
ncbi:hypothetical protein BB987_09300 [Photorhabdus temperata]|uniref:Uncharacterized protein n=1 Tax=Photorhabdus khanii NC19 TaxID=1004151 RepID=W3V7L7_9GAMM|nr:hypothetical protein PTE_03047 [Photorhabdus khanii NC19]OHV54902.1 hypothetical protein BB987_09300 [Photorhabdus temperata]